MANMMWARYPRVLTTNLLSNDEASGSTGSCSGVTCTSATLLTLQLSAEHLRFWTRLSCNSELQMCITAAVDLQQVSPEVFLVAVVS